MLLGRGNWHAGAIEKPHLAGLAKRIAEAIKLPKVCEAIREGSLQWTKATGKATALRRRETGEVGTDYPIPLPDMASEEVRCAALAAIHDHFPTDQKLGPQSDPEKDCGGNAHEHFADYATGYLPSIGYISRGYGQDDARRLSDYVDELIQLHAREEPPHGEPSPNTVGTKKPKRSTQRGEAEAKLIAALTKHHQYADGGCLNVDPVNNNQLARLAHVSKGTSSSFFHKQFSGHDQYKVLCRNETMLAFALKMLNGEITPAILAGSQLPGERRHGD